MKRVPPSALQPAVTAAPGAGAIWATIARPRPLPPASLERAESRRTKRSKIRSRSAGGMPSPSSSTASTTPPGPSSRARATLPRLWRAALSARLRTSLSSWPLSPDTWPAATPETSMTRGDIARRRLAWSKRMSSRSTGSLCLLALPSSIFASNSRSSTRRSRRASSSITTPATSAAVVPSGCPRATSACWRIAARGDRSSWEASETKRRCRSWPSSRRASMRFNVLASPAISSWPRGSGNRRCSSLLEMASTSARMRSTGDSARPTSRQATRPTITTIRGTPTTRNLVTAWLASFTDCRLRPTRTVNVPVGVPAARATTRNGSSLESWGRFLRRRTSPGDRATTAGLPASLGLACTTAPRESRTWTNSSSSLPTGIPATSCPETRATAAAPARARAEAFTSEARDRWRSATMIRPATTTAAPTTTTAAAVVRTRTDPAACWSRRATLGRASATAVGKAVPRPSEGRDEARLRGTVELGAKPAHVDLDDVGVSLEVVVPDVAQDVVLGQDLALVPQEELHECHLPRGQGDLGVAPEDPSGDRVETKVARLQHHRALPRPTPQQGTQPGHEHDVGEGLRQVVVGPGVQRLGLVELAVLGGQHEDGRPVALLPQGRADLVAVDLRQHDVQDDGVVGVLAGHPEAVGAGQRDVGRKTLGLQALLEPGR